MPTPEVVAETVEPIDRLGGFLDRRPDITPGPAYPGAVIRAGHMESA